MSVRQATREPEKAAVVETAPPAVEIRHLVKQFTSKKAEGFLAVSDVSLTVQPGQTMVLLGESGSGKTTTLRCLAGLEAASSGEIRMDGVLVDDGRRQTPPESRRVGMVFQNYALWPHMSVLDNVAFAGRRDSRGGKARAAAKSQATDLLKTVGLEDKMHRRPGQLSGGQQQRVALARALAGDVRLLLMDEPLSALDQSLREELRLELRTQIQKSGLACVYVTHDQQEALAMADILVVMRSGKIEEVGDPRDIYENPRTAFGSAFLGAKNCAHGVVTSPGAPFHVAQVGQDRVVFKATDWKPSVGDNVELRWHPEHVRIAPDVAGPLDHQDNHWRAHVDRTAYAGHAWEVGLRVLGGQSRAWSHEEPGGDILASVAPARLSGYRVDAEDVLK